MPVTDPDRSISKTHLAVLLDGDRLSVRELGSTNGSAVVAADGARTTLLMGQDVAVPDGARVIVRPSGTEPKIKCYLEVVVPVEDGDAGEAGGVAAARIVAAQRLDAQPRIVRQRGQTGQVGREAAVGHHVE